MLAAVDPTAAAAGLVPGMPLADARSFVPGLVTRPAEPEADRAALLRLAEWCGRYSPWTAPDDAAGIKLDITGCAHLWGGEAALAADLSRRLLRQAIAHRIAVAGTLGAAWALAHFAAQDGAPAIPPPQQVREALAPLPVEALRLDPATVAGLRRVGLRRIGDLVPMPRDALARRFGAKGVADNVIRRLDQLDGTAPEPLSPLGAAPTRRVRLSFAEPIADPADLAAATRRLAGELVRWLGRDGVGARRIGLGFHRVDGRVEHIRLGTARPSRDPAHLAGLLLARLDTIDPGLGVEDMILAAFAVEPLGAEQCGFAGDPAAATATGLAPLLDRLAAQLGARALSRLEPRDSHIPERASVPVVMADNTCPAPHPNPPPHAGEGRSRSDRAGVGLSRSKPPRPVRLFEPPEPVEAFWVLPDDPPFRFFWRRRRHLVAEADGPERIAEEWWRPGAAGDAALGRDDAIRDYYRVEDETGRRFWLFRAGLPGTGRPPRWFVHGIFA